MADAAAELFVDVGARETVSAVLARLETQLVSTNSSVEKIATAMEARLGNAQQKAAQDALTHAQAQARLQVASGDTAGAIRTMQAAIDKIPPGTTAAIRAETQLVQMQTKLAKELSGTSQFADAFKQGLFGFVAPAAAAQLALSTLQNTVQSFVDAFNFKAQLDATTASVKGQLDGFRDANAVYAEASAFGQKYNITQEETNNILSSSTDILRTSTASVATLESALIRLQSRDVSKPISEASRALRELQAGDVTSIKELFNVPAKDALKMRDEIVAGGDAVQVLTAYLDRAQVGMQALEQRTEGAKGKMLELAKAQEDLAIAQAQFAQGPGLTIMQAQIAVTTGATRVLSGNFEDARRSIAQAAEAGSFGFRLFDGILNGALSNIATYQNAADQAAASQANVGNTAAASAAGTAAYAAALEASGSVAQANAAYEAAYAASLAQSAAAATAATGPMDAAAAGQLAQAQAAALAEAANQKAADAILTQTSANDKNAQASVLAAAQQQAQQAATAQLTEATNAEVSAFLAMNPLIDAAGIAALVAAGKIPALIGQLAALKVEAYSTRDAVAALAAAQGLNTQKLAPGGVGAFAPGQTSGRNNSVDAVVALQIANAKAADDQIKGDLAIAKAKGDTAAQVSLLRRQQQGLNKDSLEYKNIEADIIGLQKGKKSGGAGGAKLSDQQKLNNSLLADQDAADNKFEDAARQHEQTLLDIQAEFAKKSLAQQKANEVSKRRSQETFYEQLTSSDLNKKKGGSEALKQIDADYQAAYKKSQELAQAGNAKLAADYLALKQQQATDELKYQEALAKAAEDKDKGEISRLQAIHKLHQDANAEEEKQLLEGGDANVNARDQARADADAKLLKTQDDILLASDRAAERKVINAQRSGKAIDEEQLKLDKLRTTYDRVAPARGLPASGAATTTTSTATPTAAVGPQTGTPEDKIVAAVNAVNAGVAALQDAIKNSGKGIESAIRESGEGFAH